jgi:hypothetical protein
MWYKPVVIVLIICKLISSIIKYVVMTILKMTKDIQLSKH